MPTGSLTTRARQGAQQQSQSPDARGQQRADITEVHQAVCRIEAQTGRRMPAQRREIVRLEPERDDALRQLRGRWNAFHDAVDGALRHCHQRVCGIDRFRLEPCTKPTRHPALPVGRASRAAANGLAPRTDPRVLIVEHERQRGTRISASPREARDRPGTR